MFKLGITGGIGSGKTTASQFFADKGAVIFNADDESKNHLRHSIALQHKIINAFGSAVVGDNHKLNFKSLAEVAFSNKIDQQILNGIMWPEVFVLIDKAMKKAEKEKVKVFVVEAALLIEADLQNLFDKTILITANKNHRIERVTSRGDISPNQVLKRMDLQISEEEKRKLIDETIENNGTIDELKNELEEFYSRFI
ncbi:MAG: dephospho-CoA kinase [Candidatus Marinimicrobia bacterium]|nr:dephospho-CoA kinase [Candidatus Neomarinimicrobiota bacterium]MBL7022594.1 dephospho-CoA kinase [Candidatus Neomarinimicrobiota bacterium]MBL7109871.1 dephospho-CoA kinase [Candidatus Neomarinimicrobiota bacterium]